jgi:periplasmic divalent cation tolerance protein
MTDDIIQVTTTTASEEDAQRIATTLVDRRLAACGQVSGPIESVYWWNDKVERSQEWVCSLKTRHELYALVEDSIRQLHPYDVPEIIAVPVVAGNPAYFEWIRQQVKAG